MKHQLILVFLIIFSIKSFSQNSKFSIELNYPIPIDENFIGENFNGIIDAGLKYRFTNLDLLSIGASFNYGILKNSKNDRIGLIDVTAFSMQPRIFAELNSESISRFHPSVGLGYTFMTFNASDTESFNSNSSSLSQTESGFNLNLGMAYDITNELFIEVQYDFIKIGVDNEIPDIKYNTNINILKIGLGYRL
ncbi:outer membrane protein [Polaribacter sp. M15]|jgi:opacity protein-like surface antigen